ncbi:unnamed protein product [Linum tenue]|uniref:Uncharacterized protein n=1 Tax=Linum tenue TaxID=586396 RepID=A0AAV0K7E6_9ROSI|nr:unnamed protein product [Linum tenue]
MEYDDEQIQLAHYIFLVNLPPDEVLVKTSNNSCTRKSLWSLSPRSFVDAEVITAVACHLTLEELWTNSTDGKGVCYLPAELQMRFIQASWKILYREQGPGLSPPRIAEFSYTNPSKDQEQLHRSDSGV